MSARSMPRAMLACTLLSAALLATASARAGDIYDAALANPARPAKDVKRDSADHPAELLRLAGIRPGMRVADFMAANGYWTEILSYVVGPQGHVLMLNNAAYDNWSPGWEKRVADHRLPNVEHRTVDLDNMQLGNGTLDAIVMIKVYHDLYWVDPRGDWPKVDVPRTLDQLARALKPGGVLLLVDHSAKPGTGSSAATPLHRIEESYARKDFESHGLELVAHSDVLRRPDDARDLLTYEGPGVGKTDRFALVFRKKAR
ncbi:MAG TPA: methyltransferase domain-containing protein [Steroidobacteraceae bacterium]|nr:methyltransferase domain-containing protein [Steroidobacteraceae bacterium]